MSLQVFCKFRLLLPYLEEHKKRKRKKEKEMEAKYEEAGGKYMGVYSIRLPTRNLAQNYRLGSFYVLFFLWRFGIT